MTVGELFDVLKGRKALVFAHVGGRFARTGERGRGELDAVELHSAWGTFEWLLRDAFSWGLRVGVVCNSDGHKGRPGASYPGASMFGSYGGLTCVIARELSRKAVWDAFKARRHYGTTGARILLDVAVYCAEGDVPMGSVVKTEGDEVEVAVDVFPTAPIVRVEVINGLDTVSTVRPPSFGSEDPGNRVMITWSGAAFRGRGRQIDWSGYVETDGSTVEEAARFSFHNFLMPFKCEGNRISWRSYTTGGICGCIITLDDGNRGTLKFRTNHLEFDLPLENLRWDPKVWPAGGLEKQVRVERLPSKNPRDGLVFRRKVSLNSAEDNPIYIKVVQEDGHMAWSSPVYVRGTSH
jgi:hypothetical protein